MLLDWLALIGGTFGALLPIANPFSTAPVFVAVTQRMSDIAFTPIAMPLLSGPGSIAVTITMATEVERPREYLAVAIGIVIVAITTWLILRSSTQVTRFLGTTGMTALTRLMGFILVCIGVQFIAFGLLEAITHPGVTEAIKSAYS